MKNSFSVTILTLVLLFTSLTHVLAEGYDTGIGISYMKDEKYQIDQQIKICEDECVNSVEFKNCCINSEKAYKAFLEYMYSNISDPTFNICLEASLAKFWIPERNTADWYLVIGTAFICYKNYSE